MKLWQRILMYLRWNFGRWEPMNRPLSWSLIPAKRLKRMAITEVHGFLCRPYNYQVLFLIEAKTSRRCLRLLLHDGRVVSSAWTDTPILNLRTKLNTYPYARSRAAWAKPHEDLSLV